MSNIKKNNNEFIKNFYKNRKPSPFYYVGAKNFMSKYIIQLIPETEIYCEPFFGSGAVFFNLSPRKIEVINDNNYFIYNFFKILQDKKKYKLLKHKLQFTLYHEKEFENAKEILFSKDNNKFNDVDFAWAVFLLFNMSIYSIVRTKNATKIVIDKSSRAGNRPLNVKRKISLLNFYHERLKGVYILNRDFFDVYNFYNSSETTFYLDPPYITAIKNKYYLNNASIEFHEKLIDVLIKSKSCIIISNYQNEIYKKLENKNWSRFDFQTFTGFNLNVKNRSRTESIWINQNCLKLLEKQNKLNDEILKYKVI